MNKPHVSIVIAAFNCEAFIDRAIKSALVQKYSNLEVIVVDDKSTDNTRKIVEILSIYDSRIRLICCDKNEGPSAARNVGIDAASGKWIAILDADDAFDPDRIGPLLTIAERYECDIVADNFVFFDQNTQKYSNPAMDPEPDIEIIDVYSFVEPFSRSTADSDYGLLKPMISRKFLLDNGIRYRKNIRHGEDWNFIFEALNAGAIYALARNRSTYLYTTRDSGFSRTKIDYDSMKKRMIEYSKIARSEGDFRLSMIFRRRAEYIQQVNLDYLGSMPPSTRPRLRMMFTAIRSTVGRRWLFSRLCARWWSAKGSSQ